MLVTEAVEQWVVAQDNALALYAEACLHRGVAYTETGEREEAVSDQEKALGLQPPPSSEQETATILKSSREKTETSSVAGWLTIRPLVQVGWLCKTTCSHQRTRT